MRVCIVYDCLFPHTVGGAERWYRNLAERLARSGHEVTYLTLRQWERGAHISYGAVHVRAVGPRMALYTGGRRRILPPVVFGIGVLAHLIPRGRSYDVVHTASFPYFSLLAAGALRRFCRYDLLVDWHEVWTCDYWMEYLGRWRGRLGYAVQALSLRIPQRAFCFSRLHARRLHEGRVRGEVTLLEGEYAGSLDVQRPGIGEPVVVFAGRHIPEKRVPALVPALALARQTQRDLRGIVLGDGPERGKVLAAVQRYGLRDAVEVPGFVPPDEVDRAMSSALCVALPSRREGYGMVVIEAASRGTPSVVVAGPDNAAVELVEEGVNGVIAPSAAPKDLAAAIERVHALGAALRRSTADWFARNAERLSIESSLRTVVETYGRESAD